MDEPQPETIQAPSCLKELFLFNPNLGKTEGTEMEKLLFFYPSDTPQHTKERSVGLGQALIAFTKDFSSDKPCETMHTDNRRHVFYECEKDFWLVMIISANPSEGGVRPDDLDDLVLRSILRSMCNAFKVFHGGMFPIIRQHGIDKLRHTLRRFFSGVLPSLSLRDADLFTALNGIHYLPVDHNVFLRMHSLVSDIEAQFVDVIQHTVFFFDGCLVLSTGVPHDTICVVSEHLKSKFKAQNKSLFFSEDNYSIFSRVRQEGFMTGPKSLDNPDAGYDAPDVFIYDPYFDHDNKSSDSTSTTSSSLEESSEGQFEGVERLKIIVFQHFRITLLFFINPEYLNNFEFYRELYAQLAPERYLNKLIVDVSEKINTIHTVDETYKYIYFNHMNLAIKTSLKKKSLVSTTKEALNVIAAIHTDFEKNQDGLEEAYFRIRKDGWVVAKKFGNREFYVIFDQTNSLAEIHGMHLTRLCMDYCMELKFTINTLK